MRDESRARLEALADAYEPGNYALCDGVYHVYANIPECCQTLRDDIRAALADAALSASTAGPRSLQPHRLADPINTEGK